MTDNAWGYVNNKSLRELLAARQIKHLRTKPLPSPDQRKGRALRTSNNETRMGLRAQLPLTTTTATRLCHTG